MLYKRDRGRLGDFIPEARKFLSRVRIGWSDRDAAAEAGITMSLVRTWLRDDTFSYEYDRARRGEGRTRIINLNKYASYEEKVEAARRRIEGFGYATDNFGHVLSKDTYYNQ
jgi:hypothetical protein